MATRSVVCLILLAVACSPPSPSANDPTDDAGSMDATGDTGGDDNSSNMNMSGMTGPSGPTGPSAATDTSGPTISFAAEDYTVAPGESVQLSVDTSELADATIEWSVEPTSAASALSQTGLFTAPADKGTYFITATSAADPMIHATVPVFVSTYVAGTVAYTGTKSGPIYVELAKTLGTSESIFGTVIDAPGPFLVKVPPGNYYLRAYIDLNGNGVRVGPSLASTSLSFAGPTKTDVIAQLVEPARPLPGAPVFAVSRIQPTEIVVVTTDSETVTDYVNVYWGTTPAVTPATAIGTRRYSTLGPRHGYITDLDPATTYYFGAFAEQGSFQSAPTGPFAGDGAPAGVTGAYSVTGIVTLSGEEEGDLYVVSTIFGAPVDVARFASPGTTVPYSIRTHAGTVALEAFIDRNDNGYRDWDEPFANKPAEQLAGNRGGVDFVIDDRTAIHRAYTATTRSSGSTVHRFGIRIPTTSRVPTFATIDCSPALSPSDFVANVDSGASFSYRTRRISYASADGFADPGGTTCYTRARYRDGKRSEWTKTLATIPAIALIGPSGPSASTSPTFSWSAIAWPAPLTFSLALGGPQTWLAPVASGTTSAPFNFDGRASADPLTSGAFGWSLTASDPLNDDVSTSVASFSVP